MLWKKWARNPRTLDHFSIHKNDPVAKRSFSSLSDMHLVLTLDYTAYKLSKRDITENLSCKQNKI